MALAFRTGWGPPIRLPAACWLLAAACWLSIACWLAAVPCLGQTNTASSAPAGAKDDIAGLIRKLGDNDYKVRQEAQERLLRIGPAARAALEKALADDDSEIRQRAADILKDLAETETQTHAQALRKNILWTFELVRGPAGPPAVRDGKVLFLGGDSKLHALDAAKGKELWNFGTFTIKVGECDQPIVSEGTVFLTDRVDSAYAVDLAKGQLLWRSSGWNRLGLPCIGGGLVYLQAGNELHALEPRAGKEKWTVESTCFDARPVLADGMLYLVDAVEKGEKAPDAPVHKAPAILALTPDARKRLWQFDPEAQASHLAAAGGVLYFKAGAIVAALDAKTGKKLWDFSLPALVREEGLFAAVDGTIYATCYNQLVALDAKTGEKKWKADFAPTQAAEPKAPPVREMMGLAIDKGGVYVGRTDGLHALDLQTGKEAWVLRTANRLNVGPVVADGVLYFGTCREPNPTTEKPDFNDSPGLHALRVKPSL